MPRLLLYLPFFNARPLALLRQYLHSQGSTSMRKPESYYRPRRDDFAAGMTIAFGTFAALLRGAQQWLLIVRGVRRLDPARGLWMYIWIVLKTACVGAIIGYTVGWLLGFLWERWHRRRRVRRTVG